MRREDLRSAAADQDEQQTTALSRGTVFQTFTRPRRRWLIRHLDPDGDAVDVRTLAGECARSEAVGREFDIEGLTESIHIELWHEHIGKLDDLGIVEIVDPDTIRPGPELRPVQDSLAAAEAVLNQWEVDTEGTAGDGESA